jgi:hypothetical protein
MDGATREGYVHDATILATEDVVRTGSTGLLTSRIEIRHSASLGAYAQRGGWWLCERRKEWYRALMSTTAGEYESKRSSGMWRLWGGLCFS